MRRNPTLQKNLTGSVPNQSKSGGMMEHKQKRNRKWLNLRFERQIYQSIVLFHLANQICHDMPNGKLVHHVKKKDTGDFVEARDFCLVHWFTSSNQVKIRHPANPLKRIIQAQPRGVLELPNQLRRKPWATG